MTDEDIVLVRAPFRRSNPGGYTRCNLHATKERIYGSPIEVGNDRETR